MEIQMLSDYEKDVRNTQLNKERSIASVHRPLREVMNLIRITAQQVYYRDELYTIVK